MTATKQTALIAYHADCIDGFTAAWVTYNALTERGYVCRLQATEYTAASIANLEAEVKMLYYSELYVVDYSLKTDFLRTLQSKCPDLKVTILDHHKTAFEEYCPQYVHTGVKPNSAFNDTVHGAHIVLDNYHSGASLCAEFFGCAKNSMLVAYVKDYDLWTFILSRTKHVNKYLQIQDKTIERWDIIDEMFKHADSYSEIIKLGKKLQERHDEKVAILALGAESITIAGHSGLYASCPREFKDDVGDELATSCGTFGLTYVMSPEKNKIVWSLRSNKEGKFDVSAIAKKYGGGGHKNAAGFTTTLFPLPKSERPLSDV